MEEELHPKMAELMSHFEDLQNHINDLQDKISSVNDHHESLRETTSNIDNEIHPELEKSMSDAKNILSTKMQHTEEMINSILNKERLDHIQEFFKLRDSVK
jgi:cell division septum initiation protein DivIVA